jgi:hypothetical protein
MSQKINILTIKNENTGNQLKAGDHTILKYQLTDGNNEVLTLEGLPARVSLLKDKQILYQTETTVGEENRVQFSINEVLAAGTYILEIIVDDQYIFPSSTEEKLYIVSSSKNIQEELVHSYGIEQLKQEIEESCRSLIVENKVLSPSTDEELEKMKNDFETKINEIAAEVNGVESSLSQLNQSVKVYSKESRQLIEKDLPEKFIVEKIVNGLVRSFTLPDYSSLGFILLEFRSRSGKLVQNFILSKRKFKNGLPVNISIPLLDEGNSLYILNLELLTKFSRSGYGSETNYQVTFLNEVPFDLSVFTVYSLSQSIQ